MYRTVVTICTASLTCSNSTFCPHSVVVCFVWIPEQTAFISLYSINWIVCITETVCLLQDDWLLIPWQDGGMGKRHTFWVLLHDLTTRTSHLERTLFHGVRYTLPRACYMSDQYSPNAFQFKAQNFHSTHILDTSTQIILSVISTDVRRG